MTIFHAAVIFQGRSGLAEDRFINNFWVEGTGVPLVDAAEIAATFPTFYNDVQAPGTADLASIMHNTIDRTALASKVRVWSVDPATLIETFQLEITWTLDAIATVAAWPSEGAVVLSFHADLDGSDADRRKRGRIYFGPLSATAFAVRPDGNYEVADATMDKLQGAAEGLQDNVQANGHVWGVFSRVDRVLYPVTAGFVLNDPDTQRRRGARADTRQTFVLP